MGHRQVGFVGAVHAEHAEELRIRGGVGAEPHDRAGDRVAGGAHQLGQQPARPHAGVDDPAAGVEHRPPRRGDEVDGGRDARRVALDARPVGAVAARLRRRVAAGRELHVLGQVDHHRPRAAGARDVERLVDDAAEVVGLAHEVVVLGAGAGDADGVGFLEGVVADEVGRDLAGQAHDRDRVHHRVGQPGDRVGGAGPRGHQQHPDLAGRARIALGGVNGARLVAHQDVAQLVLAEQHVVDRQHGAAGIAEDHLHAFVQQRAHDDLGPGHLHARGRSGICGGLRLVSHVPAPAPPETRARANATGCRSRTGGAGKTAPN